MKLTDVLRPELIAIGLESGGKDGVFRELVSLFVKAGLIRDGDTALHAIREREAKMTTGVAPGLGLPHNRLPEAVSVLLAIGTSHRGIDYDALDQQPVYVVVMVFTPVGKPAPHFEALAEISRLFSIPGFTERVRGAKTPEALLQLIREQE
jgi:mannitol/fructose-specific phosphotransferase system IIA component (Ntr-type)